MKLPCLVLHAILHSIRCIVLYWIVYLYIYNVDWYKFNLHLKQKVLGKNETD